MDFGLFESMENIPDIKGCCFDEFKAHETNGSQSGIVRCA